MNALIENCLFENDKKRFSELSDEVADFRAKYIGDEIVRDNIFAITMNYANLNGFPLRFLKYPIDDENIMAFTQLKQDTIFVVINTKQELNKQIFAAAHELYHIYRFINDQNDELRDNGSVLTSKEIDDEDVTQEDREANAFAAIILAPKQQIEGQLKTKGKLLENSNLYDLMFFMNCFAMPYKAMVIKLYECGVIEKNVADSLLDDNSIKNIRDYIISNDIGAKWLEVTCDNNLDSIQKMIEINQKTFVLNEQRIREDLSQIELLKKSLPHRED